MREVNYAEHLGTLIDQLDKGAFLTVEDNSGNLNTMTISWGTIGIMWRKPVFMAMVRKSRFTYKLIENAEDFTVSFPINGKLKDVLAICGTKSGRDMDKFTECNIMRNTIKEGNGCLVN